MGFGDSARPDYELKRDGLFLIRSGTTNPDAASDRITLKYMLDIYTALGAMTGLMGDFPEIGENFLLVNCYRGMRNYSLWAHDFTNWMRPEIEMEIQRKDKT